MNIDTLQLLIQGGAVGIALALIVSLTILVKGVFKMVGNHMNANTASNERLSNKIEEFIDIVKDKL